MESQPIIDAAREGMAPVKLAETDTQATWFVVDPLNGNRVERINLEQGKINPVRKRGTVKVFDAVSFNAILADNAGAGEATIYIYRDVDAPAIVAVLNGNTKEGAGWGDFRVEIGFRFTPQWKKWKAIDGQMLPQVQFAEFVDDNLGDIVTPTGADMLEIAQYLSATRSVDFKSGVRLSSGQIQLQNVENLEVKVGAGQIAIPETITLGIAPVYGLPPFRVDARFRYRIEGGKLKLGIKLQRTEDIMAAVVNDMVAGTVAAEGRMAVTGIDAPAGTVMVEGIAPSPTT